MGYQALYFLGVDPGVSGGLALIDATGGVVFATATPEDDAEILRLVDPQGRRVVAVIERVWAQRRMGGKGGFTFGGSYHELRMAMTAKAVPYTEVLPRAWQKALGVAYPPEATDTVRKNITKQRAIALFPSTRVTHGVADALLLAEYARRIGTGHTVPASAPVRTP